MIPNTCVGDCRDSACILAWNVENQVVREIHSDPLHRQETRQRMTHSTQYGKDPKCSRISYGTTISANIAGRFAAGISNNRAFSMTNDSHGHASGGMKTDSQLDL